MSVDTPYGPHRIQPSRQVAIPKELADRMNLRVGDQVYFLADDTDPGTVTIVPVEMIATWLSRGRRAPAADGSELSAGEEGVRPD